MTDRDESSKGFLERWSRKKIDAERETPAPAKADVKDVSPAAEVRPPERQTKNDAKTPDKAASKPEFDLASLPSLEWCPFTWEQCASSCVTVVAAPACAAECGAAPSESCGPIACATRNALRVLPCDPEPDPIPFGDRAWCIHAPIDGVPVRGLDLPSNDAGQPIYGAVDAPRLHPPVPAAHLGPERATACPAHRAPHGPPQSRAPPSA